MVLGLALALSAFAQKPADPPEEDTSLKEQKEYALNPVQAEKELKIGNYYAKKGSWRAAAGRFEEAVKWNPGLPDAHYRLAEMLEKLGDKAKARLAWQAFLEAAPDDKRAPDVQRRLDASKPVKK